jgi:Tfp pilus assembly PilM family ATPase
VDEIEKSYRFALGRLPSSSAGPLYLIGGGARLKGLAEVLSQRLGVAAKTPAPPSLSDPQGAGGGPHPACSSIQFPALAGCVGLALAEGAE